MFRCFIGSGPMDINDLETAIDDWVDSNATWENDTVPHELTERNTEIDGSGGKYHAIDVRFLLDNGKANLQQKFTDKLVNKVAWYRVGYHECGHDDENGGPCSWDDTAEWIESGVSIPTGVPTFDTG